MCKKFCGATVGLIALTLIGGYVLFGDKLVSYVEQGWGRIAESAEESIPPEVELERIRGEVADLEKDIVAKRSELAEANVQARETAAKVTALRGEVTDTQFVLTARAKELQAATGHVKLGGELVSVEDAQRDLDRKVKHWEGRKQELVRTEGTLARQDHIRTLLQRQYETLANQKREMESLVADMEAAIKELELQQMESEYQDDNTRLADIKEDISKLRKRIEVRREAHKLKVDYESDAEDTRSVDEILRTLGDESEIE